MSRSRSKTPKPASDQPRIFVDVRLSDGMDGGLMVREILEKLGARVLRSWAGTRAKATHLVWKDGDARTQEEARNCGAAVVGLSWVNACRARQHDAARNRHGGGGDRGGSGDGASGEGGDADKRQSGERVRGASAPNIVRALALDQRGELVQQRTRLGGAHHG